MADEVKYDHEHVAKPDECPPTVESTDRGLFDFGKKDDEDKKCDDEKIAHDFEEKVHVGEEKKEDHKDGEEKKLHRTSSSSSSSSSDEEEVDEHGEKKKKKKGLKDKIKDKVSGDKEKEEEKPCQDTSVPVEKYEEVPPVTAYDHPPHGGKKAEEVEVPPPPPQAECATTSPADAAEGKEKKGFLEKIKEKLPGFKSDDEKEKEKEKEGAACH